MKNKKKRQTEIYLAKTETQKKNTRKTEETTEKC